MKHKNFDHGYAKSVSREEFINQHAHLIDEGIDLGAIWDDLNGKNEVAEDTAKKVKKSEKAD